MTVYVVCSGEYSSYHIDAIFSDVRLAEEFRDKMANSTSFEHSSPEIEEWELDKEKDARTERTFRASINLETGALEEQTDVEVIKHDKLSEVTREYAGIEGAYGHTEWRRAIARSTKSQQHANKIVVELRQRWLREKTDAHLWFEEDKFNALEAEAISR
jgi:hypothetical protein